MTCELKFSENVKFVRFSNNASWFLIDDEARERGIDPQHVATVLAFSHWTQAVTGGKLILVDLEGVVTGEEGGRSTILLTDPAIHCVHLDRYGDLNRGTDGMESFFETHECNSVCAALNLTSATACAPSARAPAAVSRDSSLSESFSTLSAASSE